jgi:serine/threonine-protein kinase
MSISPRAGRRRAEPGGGLPEQRRSGRGLWVLTTVVVSALAALLLLLFTDLLDGGPRPIALPNVIGQPVVNAEQQLNADGFQTERRLVESLPQDLDRVVNMSPAGEALPGATIRLDVGTGPAEVEVPNLLGLDRVQAQASLQQVGLVLSPDQRQQVVQDEAGVDRVRAQDPPAGRRLTKGKSVIITVGVPPATVPVPDVVGTNIDQAQRNITGNSLTVQIQEVDSTAPEGQVLKQNPAGGTAVKAGTQVVLTVSRGNQLQMPDLRGQTLDQAKNTLQRLGFAGTLRQLSVPVNDPDQVGIIVAQDVPAGSGFARDQTITITVGTRAGTSSTTTNDSNPGLVFPP